MFTIDPCTQQSNTPRILSLRSRLARLRPVRLMRLARSLLYWERRARLLGLLACHFPDESVSSEDWTELLYVLCSLTEKNDWFVVDWDTLDWLWDSYQQVGDDGYEDCLESDFLMAIGGYVDYVPVSRYGFSEEQWLNEVGDTMPQLVLIRGLVDPTYQLDVCALMIDYELFDFVPDLPGLRERCQGQPEPLCWLPEMVDFCRRETGNLLLDTAADPLEWVLKYNWRWDSAEDLAEAGRLSAEAEAAWKRIRQLIVYCDHPAGVTDAVRLLAGVEVLDG